MARRAALVATLAVVLGGCGDDRSSGAGGALSYLPRDSALVALVSTELGSDDWRAFDRRLFAPSNGGRGIEQELRAAAREIGISYEDDLAPLLGGELVVGLPRGTPLPGDDEAAPTLALDTGDGPRAVRLLRRVGLERVGEHRGARLYGEQGQAYLAVDGDVVVLSFGEDVRRALDRADSGDGLTAERVEETLGDLPDGGFARIWGDFDRFFARAETRRLRSVPWLGALRDYAIAVSIAEGGVRADLVVRTDAGSLSDADLPLAAGEHALRVPSRPGELLGASHDQSRTTRLLWRAVLAAYPDSRFVRDVREVERALRIDFERDVLAQFARPSASALAPGGRFGARSELADPDRMRALLPRLAPEVGPLVADLQALRDEGLIALLLVAPDAPIAPRVLERASVEVERLPGRDLLYRVSGLERTEGELAVDLPQALVFGMVGDVFVVASDAERAREVARAPLEPVAGVAAGTVTTGDLGALRAEVERSLGLERSPFGELVASLRATRDGLRGTLRARFD